MAYAANGSFVADYILKDRATYLANNPVVYSTDLVFDAPNQMTGRERFVYNG